MGIAQAGIAFRVTAPIADLTAAVATACGAPATPMSAPASARIDGCNRSDVMVQTFGDVCFVCNDDLAWPLLHDAGTGVADVHAAFGRPALLLAYGRHDEGGRHGYAVFEHAQRKRTRLQTNGPTGVPALAESGVPLPFEQRWLAARHYLRADDPTRPDGSKVYYLGDREVLVPARDLTGRMLQDGLEALFGVCPWESLLTPTYRFFRLDAAGGRADAPARAPAPAAATRPAKRPWWRIL